MPKLSAERSALRAELGSTRLVTITVSAGHFKKAYDLEGWREVGASLLAKGYSVAFLGGPGDPRISLDGTHDWVGKRTLEQSMAAVAESHIHLAADTGSGHVAAAYGVPVISVFGYSDANRFRPYTDRGIVLDAGQHMTALSPTEIVRAVELCEEAYAPLHH